MPDDPTEANELFDAQFLDRLRALFLRLRKRRALRKKGLQSTPATGFTREFKDYRHYTRNDDYRAIDWRLYARLERLFIRLYEEVQEFHIHIVVDTSESMRAPYGEKRLTALRLAVAAAYLGLVSQHRVNLYSIGEHAVNQVPPLKGQGNIQRVISHLTSLQFGGLTDLQTCFKEFRPGRGRYGIIFVISDLFGKEVGTAYEAIRQTSSWPGEIHFIQVYHPKERRPEIEGEIELIDVETKEKRRIWLTKREIDRYEAAFSEFVETLERECLGRQIDFVSWPTDAPFEDMFLQLLSRGSALSGAA